MQPERKYNLIAYLLIMFATCLFMYRFFFPTISMIITPDFGQSDSLTNISTKLFLSEHIAKRTFPLWTSKLGGGYPIFATGATGFFYIPNLLIFSLFPFQTGYLVSLALVSIFIGLGMYIWLMTFGISPLSALFGAVTISLSGYSIVQMTHITILQSLSLFPFIAYTVYKLARVKSASWVIWFSVLIAQQICIGFPQSVFITLIFSLAYYLWLIKGTHSYMRDIFRLAFAGLMGIALSAVQLLPSYEYAGTLYSAGIFDSAGATMFSYPAKHLAALLDPFIFGNPAIGTYPDFLHFDGSIFWENTNYIGVIPILLILTAVILIGIAAARIRKAGFKSRPHVYFFLAVLFISFLFMLGKHSPLYLLFSVWPLSMFRVPSRYIWLFIISLGALTAFSLDYILSYIRSPRSRVLVTMFLLGLGILNSLYVWSPYHLTAPADKWMTPPSLLPYIDTSGFTYSLGSQLAYNSVYALNGWNKREDSYQPSMLLRNTFSPDLTMLWGVPHIHDYSGRQIRRNKILTDLLTAHIGYKDGYATVSATGTKLLSALGVSNVVSTLELSQDTLNRTAVVSDSRLKIGIYRNAAAVPKAYLADTSIQVRTTQDAVSAFSSDRFIPGVTVLTESPIPVSAHAARLPPVRILKNGDGYYTFSVDGLENPAVLVITETFYPGWHITVDGKKNGIFPVNIRQLGTVIPQGNHVIEARYMPDSFRTGGYISMGALAGMCLYILIRVVLSKYRQNRRSGHNPV